MPLVYAGVCSHAPGITGRADQADPNVCDAFYAAFDEMREPRPETDGRPSPSHQNWQLYEPIVLA